jgi:predicted dehydrogenase
MPSASEPLRIIQVGAGQMGRAWLRVLSDSPDVVLVGLVDLDPTIAAKAAADTGHLDVTVGATLEELIATVDADAVLNVTVPAAHQSVSAIALRHGLPVLCEKPLAETVSTALAMVAQAEVSDRLLMVSQSRRYFQHLDTFRAQIAQLGPIGALSCTFRKAPHFGGFRETMPYPLLIDMAIHQFDLSRLLVGADPVAVYCDSFNPSWSWFAGDAAAEVIFEFAGGARFAFSGNWCSPGLETSWNGSWRVSAADGTALWDGDNAPQAEDADGRPVGAAVGEGPEQIAGSLAEFVRTVRAGDRSPSGEVHSNLLSLAMVEAAIRSATEKRRVSIAEILTDAYDQAVRDETDPELLATLASWPSVHEVVGGPAVQAVGDQTVDPQVVEVGGGR